MRNHPNLIAMLREHMDADDTIFFARQLETIDQKPYEVIFSGNLARRFIPAQEGVDPTSNVYTWRTYEMTGDAEIQGPGVTELPTAGVEAGEQSVTIKQIPMKYGWLLREIQQAAKVGAPLDMMSVRAAKRAIDTRVDKLLAFGDARYGIKGIYNLPGVLSSTAGTKTTSGKDWKPTTPPAELLADWNLLLNELRSGLKQAGDDSVLFPKFTILAPSNDYGIANTTPRSTTSDTTILEFMLKNEWIESIEEWHRGDAPITPGTPRHICFARSPDVVAAVVPVDFQSYAPQLVDLSVKIPCFGSSGGCVNRMPVAVRYLDTH